MNPVISEKVCAKCGSKLIELSQTTSAPGNPNFPMTKTIYRCSDDSCQASIDKLKRDLEQQKAERLERAERNKNKKPLTEVAEPTDEELTQEES